MVNINDLKKNIKKRTPEEIAQEKANHEAFLKRIAERKREEISKEELEQLMDTPSDEPEEQGPDPDDPDNMYCIDNQCQYCAEVCNFDCKTKIDSNTKICMNYKKASSVNSDLAYTLPTGAFDKFFPINIFKSGRLF